MIQGLRNVLDLYAVIAISLVPWIASIQAACEHGDIRLAGGSTRFEGRVEVCVNNEWGTVCDDSFTSITRSKNFVRVLCRQLGLSSMSGSLTTSSTSFGTIDNPASVPIHLDEVVCTGEEGGIIDCDHISNHDCFHAEDVGVICSPGCVENSIRLADGDSYNSGRVELCFNESWSTVIVSEVNFTLEVANVICRQLGFSDTGTELLSSGILEGGFGLTLSLDCIGNETEFSKCAITLNGSYDHTRDLGVVCERCTDRCDLGSTRETCVITETSVTATELVETTVPGSVTNAPNRIDGSCNASVYGAIIGILIVALLAVIVGWVTTCVINTKKREYSMRINTDSIVPTDVMGREHQNSIYGREYEEADPYSNNATKNKELDDDFVYNASYGKVHQYEETSIMDQNIPTENIADDGNMYIYPDTSKLDNSESVTSDPSTLKLGNPLYEPMERDGDTMERASTPLTREYSKLDRSNNAPEGPVESRPRRNRAMSDDEEYSKTER